MADEKFMVTPGDIFRDKDPRMEGRHLKVVSADSRHAYVINCAANGGRASGRKTRVSLLGLRTRFERVGGSSQREDLEHAVLSAAEEWREAREELLKCRDALASQKTYAAYSAWEVANRHFERCEGGLSAAILRARGDEGKGGEG